MNTKSIYNGTPTISVIDNRGLQIRTLEYNRVIDEDPIDEYITRNTYTLLGNFDSSMDPRLFSKYQNNRSTLANMRYSTSLKDNVLCTESVDAGRKTQLFDIEGRLTWFMDANCTQTTMEYDLIGRPTAVLEKQVGNGIPTYRERFIYGENEIDAQANNLCGQLVRHYDTAGRIQTKSFALSGMPLDQSRQLLKNIDQLSNWSADGESTWIDFLNAATYDISWQYDVQGKKAAQIDAKGNLQAFTYNVVGQPKAVSLTLKGQTEQRIANRIEYNAAGQVQKTEAGNGILTEYLYEESTQRLMRKKDSRELSSGKRNVLQDYYYKYDPVGNILSISNEADSIRFFRNQMIESKRQYTYDALYQLVSSSGREADVFRQQQSFPSLITPIPLDDSQYVNYFEKYSYDRAGNLIKLIHKGASQYTTDISIDDASNRGIRSQRDKIPDIANSFDRAGNQKHLLPGIPMEWDTRNQLCRVNMVVREEEDNDRESYIYDGLGMRLVKRNIRKTKNTTQTDTSVYLPGLELRTSQTGENVTELLHVITVDTGVAQVRILHWENETQPNGIENDQYRYNINDHLGSSVMESNMQGQIITKEEFYPYGGTALWAARTEVEANYKATRYSGKELDATGLYYYGYRYYMPWLGRWLNPDPAGTVDGLNLYRMVGNNPINSIDKMGLLPEKPNIFTLSPQKVAEIETQTDLSNMKVNLSSLKMNNTDIKWDDIRGNFDNLATKLVKIAVNHENTYKKEFEGCSKKQLEKAMKALGPAVAVAYNLKSEKYHVAINQIRGDLPEKMDARIKELVPEQMPEGVRKIYSKMTKGAGSHAEVYASNSALLDSSNTKPEDLIVYVNRVNSRAKEPAEIRPFITCPDCAYILEGPKILGGVLGGIGALLEFEGVLGLLTIENPEDGDKIREGLGIKTISNITKYWKRNNNGQMAA
ncbi:toxin (plasmid) [Bacillus sp. JAS24-2]|uniref:RHS repeat-associated core domain-containing protein n=1 Tax=Bacillus sp. JAS24-2 TaxID=2217832 RepID=UPI0011EE0F02|nr:RHS repeat-associated core domain-containing protein [Bacillus sp. JAS24-2]QEL82828.1 toxin [Bacillus sp. JAS24-2]